jgi:HlyD family secretion protein
MVWLILLAILLIAGTLGARAYWAGAKLPVVETVRPRVESPADSAVLVATGYVVSHHKIQVGSKIMGRVAWIGVEKGDRVQKDQVVVKLEDREYGTQYEQARAAYDAAQARLTELERGSRPEEIQRAKADVERAEAQLRTDEANYRRTENLVREGVGAVQLLDEAKGRYETSKAALDSLTKTYELTRQGTRIEQIDNARSEAQRAKAAADYAKTMLDATEIRVPIAGTILERNVEQGEMVTTSFVGDRGAKSFVVTLADLHDLQVELDITQNDFNRIHAGQSCTAVTDAYPDRPYKCRVDEIAPEANRQKATIQVKVKFLEPDVFVKPEMNARVNFLSDEASTKPKAAGNLLIVPHRAILDREGEMAVYVVDNGVVHMKPVTVEREVGTDVQISSGLSGGESIIIGDALNRLKPGDHVDVK